MDEVSVRQKGCRTGPAAGIRLFIDVETLGLTGLPFLIQYQVEGKPDVSVVHVLEQPPEYILELIEAFAQSSLIWVGHNLMFDVAMLAKLATVASMVSDWSFESIWNAEALWRGEVSYEERLRRLRLVYPGAVEDTLIAASSLPPLEEQFLKSPIVHFNQLPVAVLPELEALLREALDRQPFYAEPGPALNLGARLRSTIAKATKRDAKKRIANIQQREDLTALEEVTLSFRTDGFYGLKDIARILGYAGECRDFALLDDFGRIPKEPCPTIRDESLYRRLYDYVRARAHDAEFLAYARSDIEILRFVHAHFCAQPGFDSLRHDFAVVPIMANQRLYGVHVDPQRVGVTQKYYEDHIRDGAEGLQKAGLGNYNSTQKVIRFVNRILRTNLDPRALAEIGEIGDMKERTLDHVLQSMTTRSGPEHKACRLVRDLVQVRRYSKRLQFLTNIVGDTLYPQFRIKGTQTDRMTSQQPSIQNMPARSTDAEDEDGIRFREIFTPPDGYEMLVGDFDQFEMRLVAGVAREPELTQAFQNGVDTHAMTALRTMGDRIRRDYPELARMNDRDLLRLLAEKDPRVKSFRAKGKVLNFATIYGASEGTRRRIIAPGRVFIRERISVEHLIVWPSKYVRPHIYGALSAINFRVPESSEPVLILPACSPVVAVRSTNAASCYRLAG